MKAASWLSALLSALLWSTGSAQSTQFTLGIVRPDGRIVPFAAYENGKWERAWPEPDEDVDRTPTLGTVSSVWRKRGEAVPKTWHVWPKSGANPFQAHVGGVDIVEAHCNAQIALTTDIQPRKEQHSVKFGVAVDSNLPLRRIDEVPRSDVIWRNAEQLIGAEFDRLEAAKTKGERLKPVRESPNPVAQIVSLYRETGSSPSPMYFVAERKYRTDRFPEDPGCPAMTIVTGWLLATEAGALVLRAPEVFVTNCDMKEARFGLPLAAAHVSDRLFWVLQEHGYEDETYGIVEIRATAVQQALEVNGGGC